MSTLVPMRHCQLHCHNDYQLCVLAALFGQAVHGYARLSTCVQGGKLIWIAPSGGRDRPNADGQWIPDTFDPAAVELMRQMLAKAKPPGHLYPLAMHSGEIMPPPPSKEKDVGEHRITRHAAVGKLPASPSAAGMM